MLNLHRFFWVLDSAVSHDKGNIIMFVAVVTANKKDRRSGSTGNIEILLEIQSDTTNSVHSNIHTCLYAVFSFPSANCNFFLFVSP